MGVSTNQQKARKPKKTLMEHLNDEGVRAILYQVLFVLLAGMAVWYLASNTISNLEKQNVATGFSFLNLEAAFGISETMVDYEPSDTYAHALYVGFLNTVKVSAYGIIFTSIIGVIFGIARLSHNLLVRSVATVYVDIFRNIPILLQLMFWYALIINVFPHPKKALNPFSDVFLTNRGIYVPIPEPHPAYMWMLIAAVVGCIGAYFLKKWADKRQAETGQPFPTIIAGFGVVFGCALFAYVIGGMPTAIDTPALKGFGLRGGWNMSPEFVALFVGLTVYTSTYVAEIVRSGILAVPKGQWEAAESLGLKRSYILRHVVLPQSMRVAIPPLTNQFLNLTKNSSLAVAIGYPDIVSVANTTMNQTGQAIEAILIFMTVYLTLSILTSLFMNWFNAKMALVER
ncbi:MAG: amino acid ABC transporter permease [Rhodospirillales bacterium]|nr:amino acid ABC transporter permease [Rhodospirillales bacterium]